MSYDKQKKQITIKIIPHVDGKLISFKISKFLFKSIITFLLTILLVSSLGFLFYYNQNSKSVKIINNLKHVKYKNEELKNKLHILSKESQKLKAEFKEIQDTNQEIKRLINYDSDNTQVNKKTSVGSDIDSRPTIANQNYQLNLGKNNNQIVNNTENRLAELKALLPKKKIELKELKDSVIKYKDYLAAKPTGWPLKAKEKRITSYFGYRTHPVTGERTIHEGLDIGVWYGTKVYATGAGRITHSGWKGGYGKAVIIDHGYGLKTIYAHNRRLNVRVGDKVKRGDIIAYSGNSGRSTGPHLHYEITINGKPIDPLPYIK
ncbi:M23 family metallopeptidase [Selenihalanaerobacter shriftii]|uniref:Peptidase family M23 n=1 Tax=Selenihalanaerobacter shriftii TaxID=142842 RepID=A0A1T4NMX9_9FIRM|nr:M23 family metallopeptidase [Selenihalanaerobacter shriftii]SJZ80455.1 Peptidase family M23 [Selenihalanaerobacter shriftii]